MIGWKTVGAVWPMREPYANMPFSLSHALVRSPIVCSNDRSGRASRVLCPVVVIFHVPWSSYVVRKLKMSLNLSQFVAGSRSSMRVVVWSKTTDTLASRGKEAFLLVAAVSGRTAGVAHLQ